MYISTRKVTWKHACLQLSVSPVQFTTHNFDRDMRIFKQPLILLSQLHAKQLCAISFSWTVYWTTDATPRTNTPQVGANMLRVCLTSFIRLPDCYGYSDWPYSLRSSAYKNYFTTLDRLRIEQLWRISWKSEVSAAIFRLMEQREAAESFTHPQ